MRLIRIMGAEPSRTARPKAKLEGRVSGLVTRTLGRPAPLSRTFQLRDLPWGGLDFSSGPHRGRVKGLFGA